MADQAVFSFHEPLDGFDGKDVGNIPFNGRFGHMAARVAGEHIVGYGVAVFQSHDFLFGINRGCFSLQECAPLFLDHMPGGEADIFGPVGAGKHPRTHARVVVKFRWADDGDVMTLFGDCGQVGQGDHVGVASADKHQLFFHDGSIVQIMGTFNIKEN